MIDEKTEGGLMNPGRELDALVAEKVFGCKVSAPNDRLAAAKTQREYEMARNDRNWRCGCEGLPHEAFIDPDDRDMDIGLKYYSTDIAAAWEVIAALPKELNVAVHCDSGGSPRTWVTIYPWGQDLCDGQEIEGKTAPHAICLAALKAVGAL